MITDADVYGIIVLVVGIVFWAWVIRFLIRIVKGSRTVPAGRMTVKQFLAGDLGLAKTFWLSYVLAPNALLAAISLLATPGSNFAIFGVIAWACMVLGASIAVWRAAGRYQGTILWAWLAKGQLLIPAAVLLLVFFGGVVTATDAATASALTAGLGGGLVFTTAVMLPYWATKRAAGHVRSVPILLLTAVGIALGSAALSVGISAFTHAFLRSIASVSILDRLISQSIALPLFACAFGGYFGRKRASLGNVDQYSKYDPERSNSTHQQSAHERTLKD